MYTQAKFGVFFTIEIILNIPSSKPKLPLISKVESSPRTRKILLWLSAWDGKLLSTPKTIIFIAVPLLKLHKSALSNDIHSHYTHTFLYHDFLF